MLKGDAYSSGHLVRSHFRFTYVLRIETDLFTELVIMFPGYAFRTSISILLQDIKCITWKQFCITKFRYFNTICENDSFHILD